MKPTLRTALTSGLVLAVLGTAPALADHGNPWAGADDEVQSQFHDANQEKSIGTPGEDEMYGQSNRNVGPNAGRGETGASNAGAAGRGKGDGVGKAGKGGGHGNGQGGGGHAQDR